MQQTTGDLRLHKIELHDSPPDITVINPNWDKIDTEITGMKSQKADKTYVDQKVADIVNSAPEALDTLKELSNALGNDPNFATTVSNQIGQKVDKVSGKGLSTNDYTTAEKNKLAGIATGANNYTHPTTSGNKHIPSGGKADDVLMWSADGTAVWGEAGGAMLQEGSTLRLVNPKGASFNADADTTGLIKIKLPQSWTNTMMKMRIEIYNYATNDSITVLCGGYNYTTDKAWINTFAQIIASNASKDLPIRFGHDGTKCCITIGEVNSNWKFLKVAVTEFFAGHTNATSSSWKSGWAISVESALPTTVSSTLTNNLPASDFNKLKNKTNATQSASGLMSSADKTKLDGIATGANNYTHPNDANTRHVTDTEKATWNGKLDKTGGEVTGNITFPNEKGIYGKKANGESLTLARMLSSNEVYLGSTSAPLIIASTNNPRVKIGENYQTLYHTGNKPTANDVGAIKNITIIPDGSGVVKYTKIAEFDITTSGQVHGEFLLSGTGSYGSVDMGVSLIRVSGRGEATVKHLAITPTPKVTVGYVKNGTKITVWLKRVAWCSGGSVAVLNVRNVKMLDAQETTTTEPSGSIWVAHTSFYSTSNKPTKADVGLSNVDNTSDANKPISTATQNALNLKADKTHISDMAAHITASERSSWNSKASGSHNHNGAYVVLANGGNTGEVIGANESAKFPSFRLHIGNVAYSQFVMKNDGHIYLIDGANKTNTNYKNLYAGELYAKGNKVYHAGNKPTANDVGALPISGGTVTGDVNTNGSFNSNGGNIRIRTVSSWGGWARGLIAEKTDGTDLGKITFYGANPNTVDKIIVGYSDSQSLIVTKTGLTFNGNKVYHAGAKPTTSEIGAEPAFTKNSAFNKNFGGNGSATTVSRSDHSHSYLPLSGGTLTGKLLAQQIVLSNNVAIMGKNTSGTEKNLIFMGSDNTVRISSSDITTVVNGTLKASRIEVKNSSPTTGLGISLYEGSQTEGSPAYGIMFSGTSTFGTHGAVTGDWATYLTMTGSTNRGWIFKHDSNNIASISSDGTLSCTKVILNNITSNSAVGIYTTDRNAQKIYMGGLLVSNNYEDSTKIPTNGIFSKGEIKSDEKISSGKCSMKYNSTTESLDFIFV